MTRTFLRTVLACSLAGAAIAAHADGDAIGIRLKVGYHVTQSFELRDHSSGHLEGPEISADFPLSKVPGLQFFVTPSVMFGGQLTHGHDVDGTIYRFMLTARETISKDGLYGAVAAGAAHSESRGLNEFKDQNGFVSSVTVGMPLKFKILGVTPSLEGSYYISGQDQFRGFSITLSASF